MRSKESLRFVRMLPVAALALLAATCAWSSSAHVLYNFTFVANPSSGLTIDAAGNAYGTTSAGGYANKGVVYQLSPTTGGHLIYAFHGSDGSFPQGNLVFDPAGNLYGTTVHGGANNPPECRIGNNGPGCGVVFKLTPPPHGGGLWTETVLYNFCSAANCTDGVNPVAGVILDSAGDLYGTTEGGGNPGCNDSQGLGCGTVFELQPSQSGWTESVLYAFTGTSFDGGNPLGSLVFDGAGNLFGTVLGPGPAEGGSAFQLSPSGENWSFTVIYGFDGFVGSKDGAGSEAGLIFDSMGNLYGTTAFGGDFGSGTAFELTSAAGSWTESILYSFAGGNDGLEPKSSLVFDSSGRLYGTTFAGGDTKGCLLGGCGTVFRLTPGQGGLWTESLFRFPANGSLGAEPSTPVFLDGAGNIYGTTPIGGSAASGVVFKLVP
jgi:uncharacterized repeat protein (TIGR03803 family)